MSAPCSLRARLPALRAVRQLHAGGCHKHFLPKPSGACDFIRAIQEPGKLSRSQAITRLCPEDAEEDICGW